MKIETNTYQVASLSERSDVIGIIQQTEQKLAELTENSITLIAYAETGDNHHDHS